MGLVIDLAPEMEERLKTEATKWGLEPPDYVRQLLEVNLEPQTSSRRLPLPPPKHTPEERLAAYREWTARPGPIVIGEHIPLEKLRREYLYERDEEE